MNDKLESIMKKLTVLMHGKGEKVRRARWLLRQEERQMLTGRKYCISRHKIRGAFGKCKGPFDRSPALKPAEMKAMYGKE